MTARPITPRPNRHGLPLAAKLPNAQQERDETAAIEREARCRAVDASIALSKALIAGDADRAALCYSAVTTMYESWRGAAAALAQITALVEVFTQQLAALDS